MEYGVYMESSYVSSLRPKVLEFFTKLAEKAKDVRDFAITFKKKELAEEIETPLSSVSRYLGELEKQNLITVKGARGRGRGTVVMFNTDAIRFETSDKALVNSDTPISIDDVIQRKLPKKQKQEPKWHRRSDKEMKKANILKNEKQSEIDKLNDELELLGGVPNWAWFEKTDAPVDNYRTYLISAMYNQFAAIFVEDNNYWMLAGHKLPTVSPNYNVFGSKWNRFYGTSQWAQLEKFRKMCEEKDIDPAVYLSAQFSRSTFTAASKNKPRECRPFVNTLWGENAYNVYKEYVQHKNLYKRRMYVENADFVIQALQEAYHSADEVKGFSRFNGSIEDFIEGEGATEKELLLEDFYNVTVANLEQSDLTDKEQETIKNHLLMQLLIECGGARRLPAHVIIGMELTRIAIKSIKDTYKDDVILAKCIGNIVHPYELEHEQLKQGCYYVQHYNMIETTPHIFGLIMERQGLTLSLREVNAALVKYGKDKIPHNDFSFIDTKQILPVMENTNNYVEEHSDKDMERYTQKSTTVYIQKEYTGKIAELDDMLENLFD